MKRTFYSCILATTASVFFAHATPENFVPLEIIFDNQPPQESVLCNDQACDCSKLLDPWSEPIMLRTIYEESDQISCERIHNYARQFVRRHVPIQTKEAHKASVKAHTSAQTMVTDVCTMLSSQLAKTNTKSISKGDLDRILKITLTQAFIDNKVPAPRLIDAVDTHIKNFFQIHDYTVDDIPVEMKKEYANERLKLIFYFKNLEDQRKSVSTSQQEIQNAVIKTYEPFIQRMQYRHLWYWATSEIANLRKDDPNKIPSSYLIPNPESKKLLKYVTFLHKR